jgi:hypothetical protein
MQGRAGTVDTARARRVHPRQSVCFRGTAAPQRHSRHALQLPRSVVAADAQHVDDVITASLRNDTDDDTRSPCRAGAGCPWR